MYKLPASKHISLWPLLLLAACAGARADTPPIIADIPADDTPAAPGLPGTESSPGSAGGNGFAAAPGNDSIRRYQDSISELQRKHGAFHEQLGEQLTGIGMAYRNLGQYPEALAALNRALHITRVNHGLHTLDQVPILEQIIATNKEMSDWAALDQNHHFLYWVYRRSYGAGDPRLLPVLDRIGYWHLGAFGEGSNPDAFNHLMSANMMFQNAITIIETSYGIHDQRLLNPLLGIILVNYRLKTALQSSTDQSFKEPDYFAVDTRMYDEGNLRGYLIADAYRNGKSALEKVIDIYAMDPGAKSVNQGLALLQMGDWNLLFDRRTTANKYYTLACAELAAGGMRDDEINRLFEQPRSLPALQIPQQKQHEPGIAGAESDYVLAKFDVTKTGRTRNIEIIESSPVDNELIQKRALNTIRETRFRPRLEDGQPVDTSNVNIRYVFQD